MVAAVAMVAASAAAEPMRQFTVSLPENPKPWEKFAAEELTAFLSQAAAEGAVSVGGQDGVVFHVGDTPMAVSHSLQSATMPEEKWVIRSFGRDVVLNGGGTRGTIYSVMHFLEDVVGVRFWNDSEIDVPAPKAIALPALDASGRPAFKYRDIYRGNATNATALSAVRQIGRASCRERVLPTV